MQNPNHKLRRLIGDWAFEPELIGSRMIFITGPRQIGKTTLLKKHLQDLKQPSNYYNWDTPHVKHLYAKDKTFFEKDLGLSPKPLVAFDEIHKLPKWKNLLKGYYDQYRDQIQFVVSGSARLDFMRKSGDSLIGRYFLFRMFPVSPTELAGRASLDNLWSIAEPFHDIPTSSPEIRAAITDLLELGGFPEPLLSANNEFASRWRLEHTSILVNEDLSELSNMIQLAKIETMAYMLAHKVGSPLSINSVRGDLECSHATAKSWIEALKLVYFCFTVPPWSDKLSQAVRKEEKLYLWDWSLVDDPGARFENFVAVKLLQTICCFNERGKGNYSLHYLRTRQGQEIDFLICKDRKPLVAFECKLSDESLSPSIAAFERHVKAQLWVQIIRKDNVVRRVGANKYVISADRLFQMLP